MRITTNIPCEVFDVYTAVSICDGFILDISYGGVGIGTNWKLEYGTEVAVQINLPGGKINIDSKIVNERKIMGDIFIYGTMFLRLNFFRRLSLLKKLNKLNKPGKNP